MSLLNARVVWLMSFTETWYLLLWIAIVIGYMGILNGRRWLSNLMRLQSMYACSAGSKMAQNCRFSTRFSTGFRTLRREPGTQLRLTDFSDRKLGSNPSFLYRHHTGPTTHEIQTSPPAFDGCLHLRTAIRPSSCHREYLPRANHGRRAKD